MKNLQLCVGLALAMVLLPLNLQAALVTTLSLHQQVFTVGPTESIEIWATFSLDPDSDPLTFDTTLDYPWGLDPEFIPTHGNLGFPGDVGTPFAAYSQINTGTFYMCLIQIGNGCNFGEYDFDFSANIWSQLNSGSFSPGDSLDILLYTLIPINDAVTSGQYTMDNMGIDFIVYGQDAEFNPMLAFQTVAATCPDRSAECRLTINVVPLPPAALLFTSAIILLLRRRLK